jgi:predicted TIM-barrel enzyme
MAGYPIAAAGLGQSRLRASWAGKGEHPLIDHSRAAILERFREQIARGEPIIGGGAGTGLSAKSEEAGGIDLLIVYNSGRYRMAGRGSSAGLLAYGNANQIVKEMAYEVLPVVTRTPVLAGVNGTDPFMMPRLFLEELRTLGFAGIQNFPTVGLFDGEMRHAFEETGMSYELEVEVIQLAHEMDLLTTPYVFNPSEAERMAHAGADLIVAHMGVTTGGAIGAKSAKTLDDCVARIQAIAEAARGVNPDVIVICHGGPIAEPSDAEYIITHCRGVDGFYGASSTERLPAEQAIAQQVRAFKAIRLPAKAGRAGAR